jgi:hypothetical protein
LKIRTKSSPATASERSFSRASFPDRLSPQVAEPGRLRLAFLGCAVFLYLPLIFAGPGSNPDSLRELHSGSTLLWQHHYVLSRPPGCFPYEALCGVLYAIGGSVANNFATMTMSLVLLDSFLCIGAHFEVPHRYLLAATMAIHPVYWASSTGTIDFIWALGFALLGFQLLLDDRYVIAALMLGLSIGIRLSSVLLVGTFLLWKFAESPSSPKPLAAGALAAVVGGVLYLPEFIASGNSVQLPHLLPGRMDGLWPARTLHL